MSIKNSLYRLFRVLWSGVDGLRKVIHLLLMLFIFSVIISALSSSTPSVPASAALVIQPAGSVVEQLAGDPFERAFAELMGDAPPQTLLQDIIDGLRFAKDDDRITSVVLDLSAMPGGGLDKLKRVGDALADFRESGKPVIANADYYGQGSYYLAAYADHVYMHPDGAVILSGFGSYQNFFKSALEKLKIDWNIFRVGTYKAAVEPFMRDDMSPEYRQALGDVLDQLWSQYKTDVETARKMEPGTIDSILGSLIENLEATDGDLAQLALDAGFVDQLVTRAELQQIIVDVAGTDDDSDEDYPAASLDGYLQQMRLLEGDVPAEQNVAIVVAVGEILDGKQPPGTIGGDSTASLLKDARKDDSVKAVVFRVDSPGGSAFASEVILNEVEALRAAGKPVVVSMSSVAASGGYWVSMAADSIYASPYTITGSIGIFGMFPTFQRSLDTLGVSTDGIGTTTWAGQLRPDREMSDEAKQLFQMFINKGYDDFISGVATHRGMEKAAVDNIAQGRIWTGNDALENGLIDGLGDMDEAVRAAAELADLGDDYGRKYIEQELGPGEQLALDLMAGARHVGLDVSVFGRQQSSLERVAALLEEKLSPLVRFNDPKGLYALCFCEFN